MHIDLVACRRSDAIYSTFRTRHYITNNGCHGQQLHYLIYLDGQPSGIISGASSVYAVKPRDEFFGLASERVLKGAQLSSLINNVVFRLENAPRNCASQVLAMWRKRIARDWEYLYQVRVAGFETFVIEGDLNDRGEVCTDRTRTGALYRADNWTYLGLTQGSTKQHSGLDTKHIRKDVCKKLIFARKVRGVRLASEYKPTWQDKEASKLIAERRLTLLSNGATINQSTIDQFFT
jgi:hypothetical protein